MDYTYHYYQGTRLNHIKIFILNRCTNLVELTHDEHGHPHEVEDAVEEHPEHPGGAGGDLGQIEPETVLGITSGTVDPPVWGHENQEKSFLVEQKYLSVELGQ